MMRSVERHVRRRSLLRGLAAACALLPFAPRPGVAQSNPGSRLGEGAASVTAELAAWHRAVHQILDHPPVLRDDYAVRVVDAREAGRLQRAIDASSAAMRAFIAMRSRYAEDRLAAAVERGVRQYVVLGAGLDTFACRNPYAEQGLKVFEVDHPATQRWKRARLAAAGIALPADTTFVPVDFETQTLAGELDAAGFAAERPAVYSMLGVVIYLTEAAVMQTLSRVAGGARGSEIAFDFSLPMSELNEAQRRARAWSLPRMAALGEPWQTFFSPAALHAKLLGLGFGEVELLSPPEGNRRYFDGRRDGLRHTGASYMAAARV